MVSYPFTSLFCRGPIVISYCGGTASSARIITSILRSSAGTTPEAASAGVSAATAAGVVFAGVMAAGAGLFAGVCCAPQIAAATTSPQPVRNTFLNKKTAFFAQNAVPNTVAFLIIAVRAGSLPLCPVPCALYPAVQNRLIRCARSPDIRESRKIQAVEVFRVVANRTQRKPPVLKIEPTAISQVVLHLRRPVLQLLVHQVVGCVQPKARTQFAGRPIDRGHMNLVVRVGRVRRRRRRRVVSTASYPAAHSHTNRQTETGKAQLIPANTLLDVIFPSFAS